MSSVIYKSKFSMGNVILSRDLMIPYEMFLRDHSSNTRIIAFLGIDRGRVGGLRDKF